jgi:hypothetical protein
MRMQFGNPRDDAVRAWIAKHDRVDVDQVTEPLIRPLNMTRVR